MGSRGKCPIRETGGEAPVGKSGAKPPLEADDTENML